MVEIDTCDFYVVKVFACGLWAVKVIEGGFCIM